MLKYPAPRTVWRWGFDRTTDGFRTPAKEPERDRSPGGGLGVGRRVEIGDTVAMSRWGLALGGVAVAAAMAAVAWQARRPEPPDPVFHGRPLHVWLKKLDHCEMAGIGGANADGEQAVMRDIGTNALPTLTRMLTAKDSPLELKVIALARKQNLIKFRFRRAELKHLVAAGWLESMGANAAPAVPDLLASYRRETSPYARASIAEVLGSIGPGAQAGVSSLLQDAGSTNDYLRSTAIASLGKIRSDPGRVVPALIRALHDPDDNVRLAAADSLGEFGAAARPAVPALMGLLTEHGRDDAEDAAEALGRIANPPNGNSAK